MDSGDWARLALLLGLGLLSTGFAGWLAGTLVGTLLAVLLHWQAGPAWPDSILAGIAVAFLFLLLPMLSNLGFAFLATLLLGVPALFISRFACHSTWLMALADASAIVILLPPAILRPLVVMGVLKSPEKRAIANFDFSRRGSLHSVPGYSNTYETHSGGAGFGSPPSDRR